MAGWRTQAGAPTTDWRTGEPTWPPEHTAALLEPTVRKADVKKVMFTGFGTQNVQGLANGLLWGVDGWVYGSSGSNGGEIKDPSKPDAKPAGLSTIGLFLIVQFRALQSWLGNSGWSQ